MFEKSFHEELEQKVQELKQTQIRLKKVGEALRISEDRYPFT